MSDTTQPSAWKPLIDDWVVRERQLRPHLPVRGESVRVRDAVEVGDQAYVLLTFDVDHPWPQEENVGQDRLDGDPHTAVLQAERTRQPWRERDSTRAASTWRDPDGNVTIHEHLLGQRRAFSGNVQSAGAERVQLVFDEGDPADATVVEGWFIAIVPDERRLVAVGLNGSEPEPVGRIDVDPLLAASPFSRDAADAMYFSPLDLRSVISVVQWVRSGDVVVVATCIEQYDEGGVLRLRIDGVRTDDDTFVTWPAVTLEVDGEELPSAVCGEYSLADTISLDIGFRPWLPTSVREIGVRVAGIRGANGEVDPVVLALRVPER